MTPDVFRYRPEGSHIPEWEMERNRSGIPAPFSKEIRSYTDPETNAVITEKRRISRLSEDYERIESLGNGVIRHTIANSIYHNEQSPNGKRRESTVILSRNEIYSHVSHRISYFPHNQELPLNIKVDMTDSGVNAYRNNFPCLYAGIDRAGKLAYFELEVLETQDDEEEYAGDFRSQQPYQKSLEELSGFSRLGVNLPWPRQNNTNRQELKERIRASEEGIRNLVSQYITDVTSSLSTLSGEEAISIALRLTEKALDEYHDKGGELSWPWWYRENMRTQHPFVIALNKVTGDIVNSHYDSVKESSDLRVIFIPNTHRPSIFQRKVMHIIDDNIIHANDYVEVGKNQIFDANRFNITREEGHIVFQFQRLTSQYPENKRTQEIRIPSSINMDKNIPLISSAHHTIWKDALPDLTPSYRRVES